MEQTISMQTILFVCSVILCTVGVGTFIVGLTTRAKQDGVLQQKVDNALAGISDIKVTLTKQNDWKDYVNSKITKHDERISTLFRRIEKVETAQGIRIVESSDLDG